MATWFAIREVSVALRGLPKLERMADDYIIRS
jgi:hypothetical protein